MLSIFKQMEDAHYDQFIATFESEDDLVDFLQKMFITFRGSLFSKSVFAKEWFDMIMLQVGARKDSLLQQKSLICFLLTFLFFVFCFVSEHDYAAGDDAVRRHHSHSLPQSVSAAVVEQFLSVRRGILHAGVVAAGTVFGEQTETHPETLRWYEAEDGSWSQNHVVSIMDDQRGEHSSLQSKESRKRESLWKNVKRKPKNVKRNQKM